MVCGNCAVELAESMLVDLIFPLSVMVFKCLQGSCVSWLVDKSGEERMLRSKTCYTFFVVVVSANEGIVQ